MGYRGKLAERERARELRAQGMSLLDIASELQVSKSSVSLWVRDMDVTIEQRRAGWWTKGNPHPATLRKQAQIQAMNELGLERLGQLSEQAFLAAGAALYAGEGGKTEGEVLLSNSDPNVIAFFLRWFRHFFEVDESRLRVRLYLHEGLDMDATIDFWSELTGIPRAQFHKPYRAVDDASIRHNKHRHGCVGVRYGSVEHHRAVMGLVRALLTSACFSGVAQSAAQGTVNAKVLGSSPSPGAPPNQGL